MSTNWPFKQLWMGKGGGEYEAPILYRGGEGRPTWVSVGSILVKVGYLDLSDTSGSLHLKLNNLLREKYKTENIRIQNSDLAQKYFEIFLICFYWSKIFVICSFFVNLINFYATGLEIVNMIILKITRW